MVVVVDVVGMVRVVVEVVGGGGGGGCGGGGLFCDSVILILHNSPKSSSMLATTKPAGFPLIVTLLSVESACTLNDSVLSMRVSSIIIRLTLCSATWPA